MIANITEPLPQVRHSLLWFILGCHDPLRWSLILLHPFCRREHQGTETECRFHEGKQKDMLDLKSGTCFGSRSLGKSTLRKYPLCLDWKGSWGFLDSSGGKESACNAGDPGSISGSGRSPGEGHRNPLQYSCLENFHVQRSLEGYSPWGHKESDTTEWLSTAQRVVGSSWRGMKKKILRQRKVLLWEAPYYVNAIELEWLMSGGEKELPEEPHPCLRCPDPPRSLPEFLKIWELI